MPIYEYRCGACGKKTEVIQGMNEKPLRVCPHCGEKKLKKLMSAPAIQFKGSGFYITDYARGSSEASGKKSEGEKADIAGAAEKSEKAAPKAEKSESAGKSEKVEKKADRRRKGGD